MNCLDFEPVNEEMIEIDIGSMNERELQIFSQGMNAIVNCTYDDGHEDGQMEALGVAMDIVNQYCNELPNNPCNAFDASKDIWRLIKKEMIKLQGDENATQKIDQQESV